MFGTGIFLWAGGRIGTDPVAKQLRRQRNSLGESLGKAKSRSLLFSPPGVSDSLQPH